MLLNETVNTFRLDSLQMHELQDQLSRLLTTAEYNRIPSLDFGVVAIFSAVIGFISMYYGWKGYRSQAETQRNTDNVGGEDIRAMLTDMVRHFYRNLVILFAIEEKMKAYKNSRGYYTAYPSEEHFLKLKPDFSWLALVNNRELMQMISVTPTPEELKEKETALKNKDGRVDAVTALSWETPLSVFNLAVLLRNFCTEVDVYCQHSKTVGLRSKVKDEDLRTLQMKCCFLARQCFVALNSLRPTTRPNDDYNYTTYRAVVEDNLRRVRDYVGNRMTYDVTHGKKADVKVNIRENQLDFFANVLFEGDESFTRDFIDIVKIECGTGKNNLPKIRIIEF